MNNSKTWIAEGHCPSPNHHFGCSFHFFRVSSILQESMDVISSATRVFFSAKPAAECGPNFFRIMPSFPWFIVQMEVFYLDLWGRKAWVQIASKDAKNREPPRYKDTVEIMFINPSRLCCNEVMLQKNVHMACVYFTVGFPTNQLFIQCIIPKKKQKRYESSYHPNDFYLPFPIILAGVSYSKLLEIHRFSCPLEGSTPPKTATRPPLRCCFATRWVAPVGMLGALGMEGPRDI